MIPTNGLRLPLRNRTGPQRPKGNGDENATSQHIRQSSSGSIKNATFVVPANPHATKIGPQRSALGELTTAAVNRKDIVSKLIGNGKDGTVETGLKRSYSSTFLSKSGPQRVRLGSNREPPIHHSRSTSVQILAPLARVAQRAPISVSQEVFKPARSEEAACEEDGMEVEEHHVASVHIVKEHQTLENVDRNQDEEQDQNDPVVQAKRPRIWPDVATDRVRRYHQEVNEIKETFQDPVDEFDMTMVSEYTEDIFQYMHKLEEDVMANPDYMNGQTEINVTMRRTLVDWLLQVHLRYHMLPETLWIAVNIVDRFLSKRIVSVVKLQLVGVTAMFIASKYEEILAPSVDEFVFMTENGYSRDEILKGERIVLQTLDFKVSHYCSPYSWMRKISKADDYDVHTRTLSKFLTEVTLLDYRFLRVKPSLIAAIGMYSARRMLGNEWSEAFVFYSGYTEEHLVPGFQWIVEDVLEQGFTKQHVCQKYANKKFLKASVFAIEWARLHQDDILVKGQTDTEE
ncbi:A/B/D/E cyclin [Laetiporus sulphureus 93-53]|uniref:A/B/D/E cyclin n=1 Tax=Laetiporus sulphureus 93-53 TaxID=1314785 RepID=A0A165ERV5_9APHY|nr:A/B/D/E cyclin [Laetiporus sulphureus 93-53]KZT07639.1 A/B/D/E cyclin [Laetiporus sulphureus 93-53]